MWCLTARGSPNKPSWSETQMPSKIAYYGVLLESFEVYYGEETNEIIRGVLMFFRMVCQIKVEIKGKLECHSYRKHLQVVCRLFLEFRSIKFVLCGRSQLDKNALFIFVTILLFKVAILSRISCLNLCSKQLFRLMLTNC